MTFHVGQKVVCVDNGPRYDGHPCSLELNRVYTISSLVTRMGKTGVTLVEADPAPYFIGFKPYRFRPAVSPSIQLFRDIAAGVTNNKPIIDDPQPQQVPLSPETIRELIGGGAIRI